MAAQTPQCLFAFYTIGFALGDEPTLASDSAEDATLDDLLAETLQQLILAFIWSQNYACHVLTPSRVYRLTGQMPQTRSILIERHILVNSHSAVHDVLCLLRRAVEVPCGVPEGQFPDGCLVKYNWFPGELRSLGACLLVYYMHRNMLKGVL